MSSEALAMPDVTVWREHDAVRLNAIANLPRVLPWIARPGQNVIDLAADVANPDNVCLMSEWGGFLLIKLDAGTYEVHTLFEPSAPRGVALQACREGMFWMFTRTDCVEILTKVPEGNLAARTLAISAGMEHLYRGGEWAFHDGRVAPIDYYRVEYDRWMLNEPRFVAAGKWFHGELERQGVHAEHEDDPIHDRYVGACVEMIRGGQPGKAIRYYNRWSLFYGYAPISIVPPALVIDIATCQLEVTADGGFKVCQSAP